MKDNQYTEIEKEKIRLYALINQAREKGIKIYKATKIIRQSEKIDSLIQEIQKKEINPPPPP